MLKVVIARPNQCLELFKKYLDNMKTLLFEGKHQLQINESFTRGISEIVTTIIVWQHKVATCEWLLRLNPHRASNVASSVSVM